MLKKENINTMKVLTLQPPSPPYMNVKRDYAGGMGVADPSTRADFGHDKGYITLPYMSLLYVTALLEREKHDVSFLDAQADGLNIEQLIERLRNDSPECLVCVVNLPSVYGDIKVMREIKERVTGVKIIAIGTVCSPLADEIAEAGVADVIVRGDPEAAICDIVSALSRNEIPAGFDTDNGVLINKEPAHVTNLDELPEMPYHLVPLDEYWYHGFGRKIKFAAVFASRGCSFKCYYCPYPMGFGGCIVHRDPVKVVDEIENLQKKYGVGGILFRDQVFSMNRTKTHELCDEIIRRGVKLKWVVETRLDRVDEELLRKMKAAGCVRIHYGLESGDPELFASVGKDGVEKRMDELLKNFSLTEKIGIHPHMFMLIGLLGESWDTVNSSIKTIQQMKPVTLQVAVVTPYPGTGLYDEIKKKGLLLSEDWSQYTGFKAVARTEELSADDLLKAREMVITAHKKAVRWKKLRQQSKLFVKYLFDGSLFVRLWAHLCIAVRRISRKMILKSKLLACQFLNITGLVFVIRNNKERKYKNSARILSVHRVIDTNGELSDYDKLDIERGCLTLRDFEERIVYLKKHYNFVRLEDYVESLNDEKKEFPDNAVVLTFDDGYKDIIDTVYPVLKKHNIPMTLFLTYGFVGQPRMLTAEDVGTLAAEPLVSFGSHTISHRWLTNMSIEDAEREIAESKSRIEQLIAGNAGADPCVRLSRHGEGRHGDLPVRVFCYPDGKYNDEIIALLRKQGFIAACSTKRGINTAKDKDMELRRIPFEAEPFSRFALRMAGWV